MIETPVESPPPITNTINLPEYARGYCDLWGNIKKAPVKSIEQSDGPDFVKVYIFQADPGYYFGIQIKLNKLVYQKEANIYHDPPQESEDKARWAARDFIATIISKYSKKLMKTFLTFDKICYNQPELF